MRREQLRAQLADEAARLMYEEGVQQYLEAKHLAARRLFGKGGGRRMQFRPRDLPSNGEIRQALLRRAALAEGPEREQRLFLMRVLALECLEALAEFSPRLIGSVASGHVRRGSDVDLHVFPESEEELEWALFRLGWDYELERVLIRAGGGFQEYTHVHVDRRFPVELSVYEPRELRVRPRSSTDGKPIDRLSAARVRLLLADQHPELWEQYLDTGALPEWDEPEEPGGFDGLLG